MTRQQHRIESQKYSVQTRQQHLVMCEATAVGGDHWHYSVNPKKDGAENKVVFIPPHVFPSKTNL